MFPPLVVMLPAYAVRTTRVDDLRGVHHVRGPDRLMRPAAQDAIVTLIALLVAAAPNTS